MKSRILFATTLAISSLSLTACARNYAVEGAAGGAALGAAVAALTDADIERYALFGAAIGGVVGYFSDKNNRCDGFYDRDGRYIDDDCRNDGRYSNYWR